MPLRSAMCVVAALTAAVGRPGAIPAAHASVTVAAIGFAPEAEAERNRERLAHLVRDAAGRGARFIALPELSITGSAGTTTRAGEPIPGPSTEYFGRLAAELRVWIVLSILEQAGRERFITVTLLDNSGQLADVTRKVVVRADRDGQVSRGSYRAPLESIDANGMRIGVLAGDDVEAGVPRLVSRGASIVFVAAAARPWGEKAEWNADMHRLSDAHDVPIVLAARRVSRDSADTSSGVYAPRQAPRTLGCSCDAAVVHAIRPPPPVRTPGLPLGLPATIPARRLSGGEQIEEVGRRLFNDRGLSSTGTVACASCHRPDRAFASNEESGRGVHGRTTRRNVPSLLNVAFRALLQWDGYASSLENFAKYPLSGHSEMNFHYLDRATAYARSQGQYRSAFGALHNPLDRDFDAVALALAAYQRSLISGNSPFDRYWYGGDTEALTAAARRGLDLFTGRARCATCHVIGPRHALFTDGGYHDLGIGFEQGRKRYRDLGLGGISTDEYSGMFLTPPLRNVALTAPYMHDGSLRTLMEVVSFYVRGGGPGARTRELAPLSLTADARADLVAFLESLTGDHAFTADGRRAPVTARRR